MASADVFGNEVGTLAVINAADAKITSDTGSGKARGLNITYQTPVQQIMTFGKDIIFAKGTPTGNFSIAYLAGQESFLQNKECKTDTCEVQFSSSNCNTGINDFDDAMGEHTVVMEGVVWGSYSIQGRAEDYFFTSNIGGVFHILASAK